MSNGSFEKVAAAAAQSPHLTALELGAAGSTSEAVEKQSVQCLADALVHHSSLQHLSLCEQTLSSPLLPVLLPVLAAHHKGLCHLDLASEGKDSESQTELGLSSLGELTHLTHLFMPSICFGVGRPALAPGTAADLVHALKHLQKLHELESFCASWGSSLEVIKSISCLTALTGLDISAMSIDQSTAAELAGTLRSLSLL